MIVLKQPEEVYSLGKSKTAIRIIVSVIIAIAIFAAGLISGVKLNTNDEDEICFYATITEVYESSVLVDGMDVNDYNYRFEFICDVGDDTEITWRGSELSFEDLDVGDNIAIYFTGGVAETEPGQISDVTRIMLLDDEL